MKNEAVSFVLVVAVSRFDFIGQREFSVRHRLSAIDRTTAFRLPSVSSLLNRRIGNVEHRSNSSCRDRMARLSVLELANSRFPSSRKWFCPEGVREMRRGNIRNPAMVRVIWQTARSFIIRCWRPTGNFSDRFNLICVIRPATNRCACRPKPSSWTSESSNFLIRCQPGNGANGNAGWMFSTGPIDNREVYLVGISTAPRR